MALDECVCYNSAIWPYIWRVLKKCADGTGWKVKVITVHTESSVKVCTKCHDNHSIQCYIFHSNLQESEGKVTEVNRIPLLGTINASTYDDCTSTSPCLGQTPIMLEPTMPTMQPTTSFPVWWMPISCKLHAPCLWNIFFWHPILVKL